MKSTFLKKPALFICFAFAVISSKAQLSINAGLDKTICQGSSSSIGGTASGGVAPYTYSWTPSTGLSSTIVASPVASPTVTTTYIVHVTDANSATAQDTVVVTVNPLPILTINGGPNICAGSSVTLSAAGASTYTWNTGANSSSIVVSPSSTTTYSVTGTSSAGCTNTSTRTITVNPTPTVTISGSTSICMGASTTLIASGASTYTWSPGGATSSSIVVSPASTTVYTVTGTSSAGCINTKIVTVTVNPLPNITISGSTSICIGASTTLIASGASTYTWNTGANSSSIVVSPASTTTYSITGTSSAGCTNTKTVTVTVNPLPSVTASGTNASCNGMCNGFSTASGALTYSWSTGATTSSISSLCAGTYTVTGTNASGCSNTATSTVSQPTAITVSFTSIINASCQGVNDGSISGSASGGMPAYTYSWSNGATSSTNSGLGAGNYTLTVTDGNSCTKTNTVTITANPLPNVTISGANIICVGASATLNASGATTYTWNTGATSSSIVVSPSSSTIYSVTGTSSMGCINSNTTTVIVNPLPGITITPNVVTCFGLCNGSLSAMVTGGTAPYMYQWSSGGITPTDNALCAGVYTLTVTDANGCVDSVTSLISEPSPITIGFSPLVNATCIGTSDGAATANVSGGTPGYLYSWSEGSTSQSVSGMMTGNYTVTVTDTNSCTASAIATIGTNSASPTATISGPGNSCQGQPVTFTGSATGGTTPYTYDWADLQLGSQSSTTTSCAIAPTLCGYDTINLKVVDVNGCTGYASASLFINYSDSLSGFVFDTNSVAVTSGYVYLFRQKINHVGLYDTMGVATIHPNGYYTFPNVPYGDYFVKVEADTSFYPTAVATYYSNKPNAYQWDSALVINHYTCNASNAVGYDVHIIQLPGSLPGSGTISGIITADPSFGHRYGNGNYLPMGAPLKGVDVKLGRNPGGTASARTTTDNNGNYTFNNVPIGDYKIYVDIPNYKMDSVLAISITATNTVSANNNYYVDSVMIRVDASSSLDIKTNIASGSAIVIYPNPANAFITVFAQKELGSISIYNSLGEVVYRSFPNLSQAKEIKIDMSNLLPGVYTLQVQNRFLRLIKE